MSALERCWQSETSSSYCERSVVIGGVAVGGASFFVCLRNCSLVCRPVAIVGFGGFMLDVVAGKWVGGWMVDGAGLRPGSERRSPEENKDGRREPARTLVPARWQRSCSIDD
jgi:hypothetical protein